MKPVKPLGLQKMSPEAKAQLRAWLSSPEVTYEKAMRLLAEKFGIKTSITALSRFFANSQEPQPEAAETGAKWRGVEVVVTARGATETRVQIRLP